MKFRKASEKALSKELHDQVGQSLTALSINLNIIRAHLDIKTQQELSERFESAQNLVTEITDNIRGVIAELHPPVLDDYGLEAAIRWYAERLGKQTRLQVKVISETIEPCLTPATNMTLFRITQEALTNIVKHAQTLKATVILEEKPDTIKLTISDNGVGFDAALHITDDREHWGLNTMRERATAVGGDFQIESSPGMGTKIIVKVPR